MTAGATIAGLESAPTRHAKLIDWVRRIAELTKPDNVKNFKTTWTLQASFGEAAAFIKDWPNAIKGLEAAVADSKVLDSKGMIDMSALQKDRRLQSIIAYYFDLGKCYEEGGAQDKANYQKAMDVFTNVLNATVELKKLWWQCKFEVYRCLDKRGEANDYKELGVAMRSLERKYPDFKEAAACGMQDKLQKLKRDLESSGKIPK